MTSDTGPGLDPVRPLTELAEQVERAAGAILRLKEQNARLQELLREAERRCATLEAQLAARPEVDLRPEVDKLLAEKAEWQGERERWEAERAAWQAQGESWEAERARAQAESRQWEGERAAWDAERQRAQAERAAWEAEQARWPEEHAAWQAERRDIALRIEQLVHRLEELTP